MLQHAMILAAGMGTRLRPLTDEKPKALVEISGVPLLEVVINRLIRQGIQSVTINVHHFPEQIREFLSLKKNFGATIHISDETGMLLDSGGGILKAGKFFPPGEDILIHNVDVISDIDLAKMHEYHRSNKALATLAVRNRITQRYYLFDDKRRLRGWKNEKTSEKLLNTEDTFLIPLAFSGISILSARFLQHISHSGSFTVRDEFIRQSATGNIIGYQHDTDYWMDVGKPDQLEQAGNFLAASGFLI